MITSYRIHLYLDSFRNLELISQAMYKIKIQILTHDFQTSQVLL